MTMIPDPATIAWLDQQDKRTAQTIRRHGTSIEYVVGDMRRRQTPFAYTIGLFGMGHPELLVFGLDARTTGLLLNDVADRVRAGRDIVPGELLEFGGWGHRVTVEAVPNPGDIAFAANRYYQRPDEVSVELLQLTYDDREGRFPWEDGYETAVWIQPRPGEFTAW
ncbi:DUF4262 domain-containing protein [Microbacterium sp.]|jgi:hypothetical protein|uniref:DUF4262 domain-containing protein n=1 Tax=Microbacterium sp. TaxID=51671 RepID=UPI0035B0E93C